MGAIHAIYFPYPVSSQQVAALAVVILFLVLSPTMVALRFYSRKIGHLGIWWDDWTVLAALVHLTIVSVRFFA